MGCGQRAARKLAPVASDIVSKPDSGQQQLAWYSQTTSPPANDRPRHQQLASSRQPATGKPVKHAAHLTRQPAPMWWAGRPAADRPITAATRLPASDSQLASKPPTRQQTTSRPSQSRPGRRWLASQLVSLQASGQPGGRPPSHQTGRSAGSARQSQAQRQRWACTCPANCSK